MKIQRILVVVTAINPSWTARLGVFARALVPALGLACLSPLPIEATPADSDRVETRYLAFQVFTGSPDPHVPIGGELVLGDPPSAATLDAFATDVAARIGTTGNSRTRLALVFGPISFDQTDAQVFELIRSGFGIALAHDLAVGFHLDDSMFWGRRGDLLADPRNIEQLAWGGPRSSGRRLDWGPEAGRAPPQMCFNSPAIESEVRRRGTEVIGRALKAGISRLHDAGRDDLFAGVIVGWETQIGRDFATGATLGYCAAGNRGVAPGASADALDRARVDAVEHFISLWSSAVAAAGVPDERVYSHIALMWEDPSAAATVALPSRADRTNFAPPETAFGEERRAGFSTYPQPHLYETLYAAISDDAAAGWASAEGANVTLGGMPTDSGMGMETYLARLFDHGATLVNIFGWGIGNADNEFRRAAESSGAITAYRKFLRGETLVEGPVSATIMERLPAKIRRMQAELPGWIQRHNGEGRAKPHLDALTAALAVNDLVGAEAAADMLLSLIAER